MKAFIDRLLATQNMIDHQEWCRTLSRSILERNKGFADGLDPLQHDVNQLMKARNESGIEVDLCSTRVSYPHGRVGAHVPTDAWRVQLSNNGIPLHPPPPPPTPKKKKAEGTQAFCLFQENDDVLTFTEKDHNESGTEYKFHSVSLEEKTLSICPRGKTEW